MPDYAITGLGLIPVQVNEYYSQTLLNNYTHEMIAIKEVLDLPKTPGYTASPADYKKLLTAVISLSNLSQNGVTVGNNATAYQSFLNMPMAQAFNQVMQSLKVAGLTANSSFTIPDSEKIQIVQNWQSLASFGVEDILANAVTISTRLTQVQYVRYDVNEAGETVPTTVTTSVSPIRSLQSMLELEYVRTANDIFANNIGDMQSALQITAAIADNLKALQLISNQVSVQDKPPFSVTRNLLYNLANVHVINLGPFSDYQLITDDGDFIKLDQVPFIQYSTSGLGQRIPLPTDLATDKRIVKPDGTYSTYFPIWVNNRPPLNTNEDGNDFVDLYKKAASAYFLTSITPTTPPVGSLPTVQLWQTKSTLKTLLLQLGQLGQTVNNPSSLAYYVQAVINDISTQFTKANVGNYSLNALSEMCKNHPDAFNNYIFGATQAWLLDGKTGNPADPGYSVNGGNIQRRLGLAISNTINLNDQQKDNVRSYLYLFQQFYESAANMLQILTQAVEKMGKKADNDQ
jgi:hypothetical protein